MRQYRWADYLVCLTPLPLLAYLGLESYGIDYRAFYLAGKAVLNGLDPYLNHVASSSQYYGPINAELATYSGWKYPPLATYLFIPLATVPYELSKNLFNLFSLAAAIISICTAIQMSARRIDPMSILIATFSFPIIATMERGQVEILLAVIATGVAWLIARRSFSWAAITIALLASFKVYPLLMATALLRSHSRQRLKAFLILLTTLVIVGVATLMATPSGWRESFKARMTIPFDQVPGQVMPALPADSGVIGGSTTVRSADARNLIHSHDFVFGFANPLLSRQSALAAFIGIMGSVAALMTNRKQPVFQQALAVLPWINIANPLAWIMGLVWYIPLFLYSYPKVRPAIRFLISLPLILPPSLNASGYLAALITLLIAQQYTHHSVQAQSLDASLGLMADQGHHDRTT